MAAPAPPKIESRGRRRRDVDRTAFLQPCSRTTTSPSNIFDKLVQMDPDSRMIPGIATSWKSIDDKTVGVQAAQGRQVSRRQRADRRGVVFSINRVPQVPNSPGPFTDTPRPIER